MRVVIIDYGSGNLRSVAKAFELAAKEINLTTELIISNDIRFLRRADRLVLPGVGSYADCRRGLDQIAGLVETLEEIVFKKARPFLGICVGMQLLSTRGLEKKETKGLGWIKGDVVHLSESIDFSQKNGLKIPQVGWNTLKILATHPLFAEIPTGENGLHAYFVHSYHFICANPEHCLATTYYGETIAAVVARDNIVGTQFHPEKSQRLGLKFLSRFLEWYP